MSVRCIVSDLDRTLTSEDLVLDGAALDRIRHLRKLGLRVVIATGRRFDEIEAMGLVEEVDGVVAENGAVICVPGEKVLQIAHADFATIARSALGDLAREFQWGRVVGSGPRELYLAAGERLARHSVAHTLEFNAGDVMLLPAGVSKASGAEICLRRLGLDAKDTWAIGDGENDAALLRWAGRGAAPANGAKAALEAADLLLHEAYSRGFLEFTDPLVTRGTSGGTR